jgi:hypothetical protein
VTDQHKPQWTRLPNVEVFKECTEPDVGVQPEAADDCSPNNVTVTRLADSRVPIQPDPLCKYRYNVTRRWKAVDDCGLVNYFEQLAIVDDRTAPSINFKDPNVTNGTVSCDSIPCPPEVVATDNCLGVKIEFVETKLDGPCDGNYTIRRVWTATDRCEHSSVLVQILTVVDLGGLRWVSDMPDDVVVNCTDYPFNGINAVANDTCTENVTASYSDHVDGVPECTHTFLVKRTYKAVDDCGQELIYVQNITVQDITPPHAIRPEDICVSPVLFNVYYPFDHIETNGNVAHFTDDCSSDENITLRVVECYSDQDQLLNLNRVNGFTEDCFMNGSTLFVRVRADWRVPEGRVYSILIEAEDECGNKENTTKRVWIPRDNSSVHPDLEIHSCIPGIPPEFCDANCPCLYSAPYCHDTDSHPSASLVFDGSDSNPAESSTTFRYKLTASTPLRVIIDIDLRNHQVLHVSPETMFVGMGPQPATFVQGLAWDVIPDMPNAQISLSFTLRGFYDSTQHRAAPVMLTALDQIASETCMLGEVEGPGAPTDLDGDATVCGTVGIFGTLKSFVGYTAPRVKLGNVVVELRKESTLQILALATTDDSGHFCFTDLSSAENYTINIASDGLLTLDRAQGLIDRSVDFIRASTFDIGGLFPHGLPLRANVGPVGDFGSNLLKLYINQVHLLLGIPDFYDAIQEVAEFKGNGWPVARWLHQLKGFALCEAVDEGFGDELVQVALETGIFGCLLSSSSDLVPLLENPAKAELTALILNHISGRGVLEPYRMLQQIVIQYAVAEHCNAGQDQTTAAAMVRHLLQAH